jgi:hypothetical protein
MRGGAPMFARYRESRIYTWTGNRYFGSSKRVAPTIGVLLLPPHFSVRVTSCLRVRIIADSSIHNNLEADAGLHALVQLKSCFCSPLIYWPSRSLSRGVSSSSLHGLDFHPTARERERESCSIDSTVLLYYGHV